MEKGGEREHDGSCSLPHKIMTQQHGAVKIPLRHGLRLSSSISTTSTDEDPGRSPDAARRACMANSQARTLSVLSMW